MQAKLQFAFASAVLVFAAGSANAGCAKGAALGGVAGHVAGKHGVAGAAVGCAIGHHSAKKKQAANAAATPGNASTTSGTAPATK